jgi:hypothetical protein
MTSLAAIAADEQLRREKRARDFFANGNLTEEEAQADYALWREIAGLAAGRTVSLNFTGEDRARACEQAEAAAWRAFDKHSDDPARWHRARDLRRLADHFRAIADFNAARRTPEPQRLAA